VTIDIGLRGGRRTLARVFPHESVLDAVREWLARVVDGGRHGA